MRIGTLLLGLVVLGGCRTSPEGSVAKDAFDNSQWQAIMTCSGGDATVDVDVNERRNFQLVVRNELIFSTFDQFGYGEIKNPHERIFRGQSINGQGVFTAADFKGFFANGVTTEDQHGFKVKAVASNAGHGGPSTDLAFTAVDLKKCAGHISSNDFPDDCSIGGYSFVLCKVLN